ncbi:four helix bundle protein [Lysobacteraceae bacterium NML71-0210]|nr:four helix bundle protein [Xanthomonadaceae bacterium NML71-0210]
MRSYRDLQIWQRAMALTADIYRLAATLPGSERYGLCAQMQRAAVSIPSNIAEGHERDSTREFLRFISIAQGSLAELETQLLLAVSLELSGQSTIDALLLEASELGRMLNGLRSKLVLRLESSTLASGP